MILSFVLIPSPWHSQRALITMQTLKHSICIQINGFPSRIIWRSLFSFSKAHSIWKVYFYQSGSSPESLKLKNVFAFIVFTLAFYLVLYLTRNDLLEYIQHSQFCEVLVEENSQRFLGLNGFWSYTLPEDIERKLNGEVKKPRLKYDFYELQ